MIQIPKILVVDDQFETAETHSAILKDLNYLNYSVTDPQNVMAFLENNGSINLVLLDIRMPGINGLEMLVKIKSHFPYIGIIMATVINDIQEAVKSIKNGAFNYLLKPLQKERVKNVVSAYYDSMPENLIEDPRFSSYITNDAHFKELFQRINAFAQVDVPILIEGESGTGKELIAQIIHTVSNQSNGPYIAVNIAAISESLFESEVFGHIKGAFTSALKDHKGYVETAENGSLFIDEIGELGLEQQKKLLRLLQNKSYSKVGESTATKMKCRIILATNKNLKEEVIAKRFREDLYYRISSHTVSIPPLRERPNDIMLLSKYFLKKYASQFGRIINDFKKETLDCLMQYKYPGNIRELEGIISSAVLLEQTNLITPDSLPHQVAHFNNIFDDLEEIRYQTIMKTLSAFNGNQTKAAVKLGIARSTLNRLLREFDEKGLGRK